MEVEFYRGKENGNQYYHQNSLITLGRYNDNGGNGRKMNGQGNERHGKMTGNQTPETGTVEDSDSTASFDSTGNQKSFLRVITRFAEKTSMQGVPYINSAKYWWARLIWSIMLLVAIAVMSLHLWYLVDQYTSWPIQTKISLGFETLKFPEVTVCNSNAVHGGRLIRYDGAYKLKKLCEDLRPENMVPDQFEPNHDPLRPPGDDLRPPEHRRKRYIKPYENFNVTQYQPDGNENTNPRDVGSQGKDDYNGTLDARTLIEDLFTKMYMDINVADRAKLGHNITDMLISCTFNGRECSADMFTLHQTAEYGNCWSIRSDKFNVKNPGPTGGLSLKLFLEAREYLKGITTGVGVRVQVHEQHTYPFPANEGLFIPASMETDIGLRMTSIERLGGIYGNCNDGKDFTRQHGLKYTRRACQSICKVSKISERCKCFNEKIEELAAERNKKLKPCRSQQEVECMVDIEKQFESQKLSCPCGNPCNEVQYMKTASQRQWPTDSYAMVLLQGICDRDKHVCRSLRAGMTDRNVIRNTFLRLNIYYEDLNFENIREEPEIEIQQFLSDVGGAIGLWIGLSILSVCELIQLFVELCDFGIHKTVKERRLERKTDANERRRRIYSTMADEPLDYQDGGRQSIDSRIVYNGSLSEQNEHSWPNANFQNFQKAKRNGYSIPPLRNGTDGYR